MMPDTKQKTTRWQRKLRENICTVEDLKKHLFLTPSEEKLLKNVGELFPISITRHYMSLIDKNDKRDPIRRLIVPSAEELDLGGSFDTSGEKKSTRAPGLQHKYKQTALILATNRCAAYCRFCFRKRLVGLSTEEILRRFNDAVRYVRAHKEITNVLISGGDPFMLPTTVIEEFLKTLSKIKHLSYIRFGSRTPVAFPDRILDDGSLTATLKKYSSKNKRIYVVTHFNHPREINEQSTEGVNRLIAAGVLLDNQTVLLKGVNDNPDVLAELMTKLVGIGVTPYYVFQCRPVTGVKNQFQVPLYSGHLKVEKAKKKLDGHGKRFKYVMSHDTGKIEIVGADTERLYFKYHQARAEKDIGRFFSKKLDKKAAWLDDLE